MKCTQYTVKNSMWNYYLFTSFTLSIYKLYGKLFFCYIFGQHVEVPVKIKWYSAHVWDVYLLFQEICSNVDQ